MASIDQLKIKVYDLQVRAQQVSKEYRELVEKIKDLHEEISRKEFELYTEEHKL